MMSYMYNKYLLITISIGQIDVIYQSAPVYFVYIFSFTCTIYFIKWCGCDQQLYITSICLLFECHFYSSSVCNLGFCLTHRCWWINMISYMYNKYLLIAISIGQIDVIYQSAPVHFVYIFSFTCTIYFIKWWGSHFIS